jgi:hypothetical protein
VNAPKDAALDTANAVVDGICESHVQQPRVTREARDKADGMSGTIAESCLPMCGRC